MNRTILGTLGFACACLFLLATLTNPGKALAQPPPRPTPGATPTPNGGGTLPGNAAADNDPADTCAGVYGTAINWGFGNHGNVTVRLGDGGWQARAVTADDGRYNFGGLGQGVGILTVESGLPTLQPMINNAAVRLSCAFHTPANIGLYSSAGRPDPPARISARLSSPTTPPGGAVNLTLTVQNSLPNPISGVIVTALFPPGLSVEEAGASKGSVEVLNARMVTVLPGEVAANAAETITLTLRAAADVPPGAQLQTVATLFYAESAADQTPLTLAVGPAAPADRSVPAPQVGSPLDPAQAPPPDVLPITGGGECRYVLWLLAGVLVLLGRGYQSLRRSGY